MNQQPVHGIDSRHQPFFIITTDYFPWHMLIYQIVFINMEQVLPRFDIRILSQRIRDPWKVNITKEVQGIFSFSKFVEDPLVTPPKDKFAPYFDDVHIGVDEYEAAICSSDYFIF